MNDANEQQLLSYLHLNMGEFGHADHGAQGLTPLRETSAFPEGAWTPWMPGEHPGGVQLQESFTAHLDSFGSTPLPPPTAVAPASVAQMDSPAKSFAGLRVVIEKFHAHKVGHPNEENREATVTNLRTFKVEVALLNARDELARDVHVRLHASLLYENGENVALLRPNDKQETLLTGQTEVVIIGGRGVFTVAQGGHLRAHLQAQETVLPGQHLSQQRAPQRPVPAADGGVRAVQVRHQAAPRAAAR